MKVCEVLIGPIAVGDDRIHEGQQVTLEDADAILFSDWLFVKILSDVAVTPSKPKKVTTTEPTA